MVQQNQMGRTGVQTWVLSSSSLASLLPGARMPGFHAFSVSCNLTSSRSESVTWTKGSLPCLGFPWALFLFGGGWETKQTQKLVEHQLRSYISKNFYTALPFQSYDNNHLVRDFSYKHHNGKTECISYILNNKHFELKFSLNLVVLV